MTKEKNFDLFEWLWYIIPGTISLTPLLFNPEPFNKLGLIKFTILAYAIGFILHRFYRIIYHLFIRDNRQAIKHFRKKSNKIKVVVCEKQTEYLYNHLIYCREKYQEPLSKIKKQSFFCSAVFASGFASLFGGVICIIMNQPYWIIYFLVSLLFIYDYILLFHWLNQNEKVLINNIINDKIEENDFYFTPEGIKILLENVVD